LIKTIPEHFEKPSGKKYSPLLSFPSLLFSFPTDLRYHEIVN
jgi:hypothetical protein